MNRPIFLLSLAGVCAVHAQTPAAAPVAQPNSPAPAVVSTAPSSTTPAVVQTGTPVSTPSTVTQIVYMPQLPSADDLTKAASAQGLTVERIVQTSNQVIAFYRNANGQTTSVAYQSLPPSATTPTAAPATAPAPAVVVTSPPPTVVYETAPRVIYYDDYYPRYYYPRYYYPPVSFSFGYNYHRFGGSHGHFRHRR
jgi:hypothetical protein